MGGGFLEVCFFGKWGPWKGWGFLIIFLAKEEVSPVFQ